MDQFAFGIEPQKLVGHVAHSALGFGFGFVPAQAAQLIECRLISFCARITLDQIEPLNGNVKLRFVRIIKQHEFRARFGDFARRRLSRAKIERNKSPESRDAVIDVNDIVANFQIPKVRKKSRRAGAPLLLALDCGRASLERGLGGFIKQIAFDVYDQTRPGQFKSAG